MHVVNVLLQRLAQRMGELVADLVEDRVVVGEPAGVDVRPGEQLVGPGVHHGDDGDEALLAEDLAVGQLALGDVADRGAVDEDVRRVDLADDPGPVIAQVHHGTVLADQCTVPRHPGRHREIGVGDQVARLPVHRHRVGRPDDVVAVQQLAGAGMAGDVHHRVALVHHGGAELRQAVDHPEDRVLVAGDQRGGQQHGVAAVQVDDRVLLVGDPRQRRQWLALGPGRHDDQVVARHAVDVLEVDQRVLGNGEVAQVGGDGHVAHHRAAHEDDLALVQAGDVEDLLDPVHVGGEAGDDDHLLRGRHDALQCRGDVLLQRREAGRLGVGGVGHEQVDALLTELGEPAQVGDPAVERELVHLEVTGDQDRARLGANKDGQGIGNRVRDRDELGIEGRQLDPVALRHHVQAGSAEPVLLQLGLQERQGQFRAVDRNVRAQLQQVGHGPDVVLVPVGEHQGDNVVQSVRNGAHVGQNQVDAGLVFLGEQHAAVDDQELPLGFQDVHVASNLPQASQGKDS
ncbi:hypothetical protein SDC9_92045 [bioreactor metagenome]|uniref:Uncharacterized protein n=1 Tax=bioreactor metagenome TaxID=1076179 RepID=A0A644ZY53_9ZZZZ